MTNYCEGKTKTTAEISVNGILQKKVETTYPPMTVEITKKTPGWAYGGQGLNSGCSASGIVYTAFHVGIQPTFQTQTATVSPYNGCSFSFAVLEGKSVFPDYSGGAAPGTSFSRKMTTQEIASSALSGIDQSLNQPQWVVKISDVNGIVYQQTYFEEPKVNISCDDDCPEGSHKCTHNKYPGYCCVSCKETGDRLKNMANKVGR